MKIVATIPQRDGNTHIRTVESINQAMRVSAAEGWDFQVITMLGQTVIPWARRDLVSQALALGADKIVMIDDDVSFTGAQFKTLIEAPVTFITGNYPIRPLVQGAPALMPTARWQDAMPGPYDERGLAAVDKAGFGFMRADRDVFDALAPHCELLETDPDKVTELESVFWRRWMRFDLEDSTPHPVTKERRVREYSGDVSFVRQCIRHGHPCYTHKDLNCGHNYGPIEYRLPE